MGISIIVPIYNEEGNIQLVYKALKRAFLKFQNEYEIIFINDGSSDHSLLILESILQVDKSIKIINFERNYGQTSAFDAGFKQANGDFILTIDADLQYDPQDLLRILEVLMNDDADAVFGRRVNRSSGLFKGICSTIAVFVRNYILNESYQDASLGGYKKECLQNLILYKETQVFIPAFLRIHGCRVKEINVKEYPRKHGRSKYNLQNRFFKRLCALLAIKWLQDNQLKYKISNTINPK